MNGGEFYSFFDFRRNCLCMCAVDSQFQCRQCQDLLENNLAHKGPIEGLSILSQFTNVYLTSPAVLIGKKNLEVRPTAVNKVRLGLDLMELTGFGY